jgi:hemolysin activation/secretion protein
MRARVLGFALLLCAPLAPGQEEHPLLPEPGEVPEPVPPFLEGEDPWDLPDGETVDRSLLERKPWTPPGAERLLPPAAIIPEARSYRSIRFSGNRVIGDAELAELAAWALAEPVGPDSRARLAEEITRHYIAEGYINSGADVPEPPAGGDELVVVITEGKLVEVALERMERDPALPQPDEDCLFCILPGRRMLNDSYLTARVFGNRESALHFPDLQRRLQVLQMNPNIRRLQAELKPGLLPGEAALELAVEENPPWSFGTELHNQLPPSVGAEQLDFWMENKNLTGCSDLLSARYGAFSGGAENTDAAGLDNLRVRYARPVRWDDTTLELFLDRQGYVVIEDPFADLDINGFTNSVGVGLKRPVLRDLRDEAWWSLSLAAKHSETELLGMPFNISPGYVNGELDLTLLRGGIDWVRREREKVFSMNAEIVAGLDALGATDSNTGPDSSFLLLRANAAWLKRLNEDGHLLSIRGGLQIADGRLPSPEQWTGGGYGSVRGYRQNELVADSGAYANLEYRIPILEDGRTELHFIAFADGALGADAGGGQRRSLASLGIGLSGSWRSLRGEIHWGLPLTDDGNEDGNLQDHGIHFRLSAATF